MRSIKLTNLAGNPEWIIDTWVQAVRAPHDREFQPNAKCVVVMSGYLIAVQESPETVVLSLA